MIATKGILPGITLLDAVEVLVSAIDARNCSFGHSIRVASYAVQIAEAAGWQEQTLEQIQLGALLHDIGQIYWPDEIIHKHGVPLTEEEREIIESHTFKGADLIKGWPSLSFVEPYILFHQEWVDGSGYPFGLKGDALPAEVQIVSLADVYEALCHPRKYKKRPGFSSLKAVEIMAEMKGKRWKCELFDAFVDVARNWQ
jgi:putative nucleotidyltransferase with HDIG domain